MSEPGQTQNFLLVTSPDGEEARLSFETLFTNPGADAERAAGVVTVLEGLKDEALTLDTPERVWDAFGDTARNLIPFDRFDRVEVQHD